MKTVNIKYEVKNNIFEDGVIMLIDLPISDSNYNFLLNKNSVVRQTLANTVVNVARLQGFQYAEITEIRY